jgi:hypothetical protein
VRAVGVAALWGVCGLNPHLSAAAPADVLEDCTKSATSTLVGLDALSKVCPELPAAITSLGIDRVLRDDWREHLTVAQLRDLTALAHRYASANSHVAPRTQALSDVLRGLKSQNSDAKSWWDRVKEWWHDWLARSDSALAKWLREISNHVSVSQGVLRMLAYGLTAAITLVALILGARECRSWLRRRHAQRRDFIAPTDPEQGAAQWHAPATSSSAEEQLSRLLRALVLQLLATGRLKADRSLTHRELQLRSQLDDEEQRSAFECVTHVAEALMYGPRGSAQGAIPEAIERGAALLARLQPASP